MVEWCAILESEVNDLLESKRAARVGQAEALETVRRELGDALNDAAEQQERCQRLENKLDCVQR